MLVVRAQANDASTTRSESQLSLDVFDDSVSLRSQYLACSYNQLNFVKITGNSQIGSDSVYTVSISRNVIGEDERLVRDAMREALENQLGGNWFQIANHTMFCLPPGTTKRGREWIAYAYVDHSWSVYNDE